MSLNLLRNQQAAESIDGIYNDLEAQLMRNIARHLRDWNQPIDTDRWLLQKLAEIGRLNQENVKTIAGMSGLSQTAAQRMLMDMAEEAVKAVDPGLRHLARMGLAGEAVAPSKSRNVKQAIAGLRRQAKDTLNLCNTTMLYKAQDAYKGLVGDIAAEAHQILGSEAAGIVGGAESRQQAVRKCIRKFNEKGIPAFVDRRGREWTPEAYVNMAMRNTAKQTAEEVQDARCRDAGVNLIQIDSHSGARPKCAKDQGKIFSLDNTSGETEDLNGRKIKYYPWNSSSYGEPDGILGINCRHHKWPFVPGVNIQRYFPTDDMDANNKLYRETQIQRALERDVRKQKRECMLYDELGDKDAFEKVSVKLKQKEAKLKAYVDSREHLHRRKDREQVVGFDKRVSAEAVGKSQAHYKNWAKSIGAESGPKTLAGYYDLKYNDSKESRLYKGYIKAVDKGNISPLVGYNKFKEIASEAENKFVGMKTADGNEISGITAHFIDRVIGQQSADSPSRKGIRNGVELSDIEDAINNPAKIGPVVTKDNGKKSKIYYGSNAAVSYNPDTGELIQVQPKRTK
ncbi:MAG: phage minor capsid protein [[Clostridium] scindens]|uniref:phage minor capsid protein n=1 Tax=Clostridium scindens (strain JCM 10418 / VPI 12708) TaxID=29347 RepID=UPI003995D95C